MRQNRPVAAGIVHQRELHRDTFLAVVVTQRRSGVLRELTDQAVQHFGHDHLYITDEQTVSTEDGASFLMTARFSTSAPGAQLDG